VQRVSRRRRTETKLEEEEGNREKIVTIDSNLDY
jgi:hypothetical protein